NLAHRAASARRLADEDAGGPPRRAGAAAARAAALGDAAVGHDLAVGANHAVDQAALRAARRRLVASAEDRARRLVADAAAAVARLGADVADLAAERRGSAEAGEAALRAALRAVGALVAQGPAAGVERRARLACAARAAAAVAVHGAGVAVRGAARRLTRPL